MSYRDLTMQAARTIIIAQTKLREPCLSLLAFTLVGVFGH